MALRIGLVARCLNTAHIRGMGRYVFELLRQSRLRDDIRWCVFGDDPRYPMTVPESPSIEVDIFEFRGDRFHFWEQIGLPLRARKRRVDILHCTETTLPLWQTRPTVVTVHDTLPWDDRAGGDDREFFLDRLLPTAMKKCAAIITISESSKNDILKRWPWLEAKVNVIHHGIAAEFFDEQAADPPESLRSIIGKAPYVVYVGGPMERKRFSWALKVTAHWRQSPLKLIACGFGSDARRSASAGLAAELRDRVYFADFLPDSEMRALYRGASAVIYPTLYEGFGFPAVEAQASGVPVIFSAVGSLRELTGPLALVAPPYDLEAWLAALVQALSLGETRFERARAAREWARRFSWSASFEKHLAVYRIAASAHA